MNAHQPVRVTALLLVLMMTIGALAAGAELFEHEDSRFWLYKVDEPAFQVLVPSNPQGAQFPSYTMKNQFGEQSLEMLLGTEGPLLTVGYMAGTDIDAQAIQGALLSGREYVISNVSITEDRSITTSLGLAGRFFSATADTAAGRRAMHRSIVFNRGTDAVYLSFWLYEDEYEGFNSDIWLFMVNSFRWN